MKLLPRTFFGKSFFRVSPSGKTYKRVLFGEASTYKRVLLCEAFTYKPGSAGVYSGLLIFLLAP